MSCEQQHLNARHAIKPEQQSPAALGSCSRGHVVIEKPVWNAQNGVLFFRGQPALHLAKHAYAEREIIEQFEGFAWVWLIPHRREAFPELAQVGDATQSRRHAIHHLNERQSESAAIHFFSVQARYIGWCDARWLSLDRNVTDRSLLSTLPLYD